MAPDVFLKILQGKKEELAGIGSGKVIDRYTRLIVIVLIVVGFIINILLITNVAFVHTKPTCNCQQQQKYFINMP